MKKLILAVAALLCVSTQGWAQNRVYVPMSSCSEIGNLGSIGSNAQRINNVNINQSYVSYLFPAGITSVVGCHFFMPANNTSYTFQPQFIYRGTEPTEGGSIILGASAVANTADFAYNSLNPQVAEGNTIGPTFAPAAPGTTKVAAQIQMQVDTVGGTACSGAGSACRDMLVLMWVARLVDNNICYDVGLPFSCCTGSQTGTCVTGATYSGDVEILGIYLPY